MAKKISVIALILILCAAMGAFAFEQKSKTVPWLASLNGNGQLNIYAGAGFYGLGIDVEGGAEFIITNFDIGPIPLAFGVQVRGGVGFSSLFGVSWIDWGVGPLASLHLCADWGSIWKFDWYIGLGLGISGSTGTFYIGQNPIFLSFASADGVAWMFSNNIGLLLDYLYIGNLSSFGVGVKIAL